MVKKARQPAKKPRAKKKKPLVEAPAEHVFFCHDGRTFKDMRELAQGLVSMSDETFAHHVNLERNDFSNWVRDVLNDEDLAQDLKPATNKEEAAGYVFARLDFYSS